MKGGVRQRGKSWYYYFDAGKVNGKRKKIERKGGKTESEAKKALKKALDEFNNFGSTYNKSDITLIEYLNLWYKDYAEIHCKYRTQISYKGIIVNHIAPTIGSIKLNKLNSTDIQLFLNNKYREGYCRTTVKGYYTLLLGALNNAVNVYKYIRVNPAENASVPKANETKKSKEALKVLSLDEYKRILKRFPEGTKFYIPMQIAFHTGMRISEVCGLTWDCVDFDNEWIKVEKILQYKNKEWIFATPKTLSSRRKIFIGKTLLHVLKRHKKYQKINKLKYGIHYTNSDFVCTFENGNPVTIHTLKRLSHIVNNELSINFTFHSFRHTHATMLLEGGANIKAIQKRLGHGSLSTTMDVYAHVTQNLKLDSVNKFEHIAKQIK